MMGDRTLKVAGLFAGVGGIEEGLERAGHETTFLCEIDPGAREVLAEHFPGAELHEDIRDLRDLPEVDLLTAGFPCKDLSQAGGTAGIDGSSSSLVGEVFRLLDASDPIPDWILFENVPFMLRLDRGRGMEVLAGALEERGFTWAYRTLDTRAFGIPHRRKRVLVLASRTHDPRPVLFGGDAGEELVEYEPGRNCGFYWTEGRTGVGWAVEAVPPLKAGSGVGIPSPPAIWMPGADLEIVTPALADAERLQGFTADWTAPATRAEAVRDRDRWALVGNAVSVPVSEWLGRRLGSAGGEPTYEETPLDRDAPWPDAAWGGPESRRHTVGVSSWPVAESRRTLSDFLAHDPEPLSRRASAGFLSRADASNLRLVDGFLDSVASHVEAMS